MPALPEAFGGGRRKYLLRLILNGAGQAGAAATIAIASERLFHTALQSPASATHLAPLIAEPAALMAAAIGGLGWLRRRERIDAEHLGQDYVSEVRVRAFDVVCRLSLRAHGRLRKGVVMLRFVNDLTALRQWISLGVARLLVAGLLTAGGFVGLMALSPLVGVVVAGVVASGAGVALAMSRRLDQALRDARRRRGRLAAALGERLQRIATANAFARRGAERRKVRKLSRRLAGAMVARAGAVGAMRAIAHITIGLAGVAALVAGAAGRASGLAEPGDVVAAMSVIAIINGPLADLGRVYEYWRGARIARSKFETLFTAGPLILQPDQIQEFDARTPAVEFRCVSVRHGVENLSAHIEFGQRIFLSGPNGSGKSTVLFLVSRLIDADAGEVLIGGERITRVGLGELRRAVSIVSPEIGLFRGSISDNIVYGSNERPKNFDEVCGLCGIDRSESSAPLHVDRVIDENGANLSFGERARVGLARALCGDPKILLLDEAEAHLDTASRALLRQVIEQFSGTVIAVTHDPALLDLADEIWRMRNGRLIRVEAGALRRAASAPSRFVAPAS